MGSNYNLTYNVDLALCIDATQSMGSLLDTVKTNAVNFYDDLTKEMEKKGKHIDKLRVRVIVFRDYIADGNNAMLSTEFFSLPEEERDFAQILESIRAMGGGDDPEDGLEALAYAMKSKWNTEGAKKRHIIVVWSDDGTHNLGFCNKAPNYPAKIAADFDELTAWWGDTYQDGLMDNKAKRLIIFAPNKEYWNSISDLWDNVLHFQSEAGNGLREIDYKEILNAISNTI